MIPRTLRGIPLLTAIAREIPPSRAGGPTPQATSHLENRLDHLRRAGGREIVGRGDHPLEPQDPDPMPIPLHRAGGRDRRRKTTPNRPVATRFGTITLGRFLDPPIRGVERSIVPREIRPGVDARHAPAAPAERVAGAASGQP